MKAVNVCINTLDWQYIPNRCYIGVKNLENEIIDFTIQKYEIIEENLLEEEMSDKLSFFNLTYCDCEAS
jgi:hypothetical protein